MVALWQRIHGGGLGPPCPLRPGNHTLRGSLLTEAQRSFLHSVPPGQQGKESVRHALGCKEQKPQCVVAMPETTVSLLLRMEKKMVVFAQWCSKATRDPAHGPTSSCFVASGCKMTATVPSLASIFRQKRSHVFLTPFISSESFPRKSHSKSLV